MTIFKCKTISISKYSSYVVAMLNTERKYEQLICLINGPNCRVLVARERRRPDWTRLEKVRSNFVLWWLISHQIIDLYNISDIKIHFIIGCCVKFWNKIRLINYIYQELTAVLFDCSRPVCTLDQHFFWNTLPAKNMEYLETTMETHVFNILIWWKWLGLQREFNSHV